MAEENQTADESPVIETTSLFYPSSETEAEPTETELEAKVTPEEEPEAEDEAIAESEETEESDETEETEAPEHSDDELFFAIGEREISLKQIKEWEQGNLRQSDYTKKTQTLADERREFEADRDKVVNGLVSKRVESFQESVAIMDALIDEADFDQYGDPINWKELRNDDIEEYDRLKAIKDKRTQAVTDAREKNIQTSSEDIQAKATAEMAALTQNNKWAGDDGKQTEAYDKDMAMVKAQLDKANISEQERGGMLITGYGQWIIDACRWRQSQEKVEAVKKKVVKIPVTTKPKKTGAAKPKSTVEMFYGNS